MGQFQQRGSTNRGSEGKLPVWLLEGAVGEGRKVGWAQFCKGPSFRAKALGFFFTASGELLKVSKERHGVIRSEYRLQLSSASSHRLDFIVSIG